MFKIQRKLDSTTEKIFRRLQEMELTSLMGHFMKTERF